MKQDGVKNVNVNTQIDARLCVVDFVKGGMSNVGNMNMYDFFIDVFCGDEILEVEDVKE